LLERVRAAQLPVLYAFLVRWNSLRQQAGKAPGAWPIDESFTAVYDDFMRIATAKGVTRLDEWRRGFVRLEQAKKAAIGK
jgi:hypothetical protein